MAILTGTSTSTQLITAFDPTLLVQRDAALQVVGKGIASATEPFLFLTTIQIDGSVQASAVGIDVGNNGLDLTVTSGGTVNAFSTAVLMSDFVNSFGRFTNDGLIRSAGGTAIDLNTGDNRIANTGTIVSNAQVALAIRMRDGNDWLENSGTIVGSILLDEAGSAGFSDRYIGLGGTVLGEIFGGPGNDIFDLRGGTQQLVFGEQDDDTYFVDDPDADLVEAPDEGRDTVIAWTDFALPSNFEVLSLRGSADTAGRGNAEQNEIRGNAGDNRISGEGARDLLAGEAGHDTLDGGRGDDVAEGGSGDDTLSGRAGRDSLDGGDGDDMLFGGLAEDTLSGGSGNDTLKGGFGGDEMTGGSGSDTFVFGRASESPAGGIDRITDFEVGIDILDLTAIAQGRMDFATGGHTGGGVASVFLSVTGSGNTQVLADVDGDGTSDMRVVLLNTSGLTQADFLL